MKKSVITTLLLVTLFSTNAFALFDPKPPKIGAVVSDLPKGCTPVQVGGALYYYRHGAYYTREGSRYMIIRPPIGAVVPNIPGYYKKEVISGATYYTFQNTYYVRTEQGYRVVPVPLSAL